MLGFTKGPLEGGGDPRDVAVAIVAAVADAASPLHVHVGDGATALLELWRQTGTFEAFMPPRTPCCSATVSRDARSPAVGERSLVSVFDEPSPGGKVNLWRQRTSGT